MESLHYLLMKSHTILNRRIVSEVAKVGFSPGQPKVLECLSHQEGVDQKTIARYCEIEQATVGGILLRMEQAGLIERRQKEGNRRSLYVYLTPKGKQAVRDVTAIFLETDQYAESGLTAEEANELKALLEKLTAHLTQARGEALPPS